MRRLLLILLLLFSLPSLAALPEAPRAQPLLGGALNNSSDFLPVDKAFRLELLESTPQQVRLRFSNADGYYLYRHQFRFATDTPGVTLGEPQIPPGVKKVDEYFGEIEAHYGITEISLAVDNPQGRGFTLRAGYQAHVTKPVDGAELMAMVASLLDLSAARARPADGRPASPEPADRSR